MGTELDPTTYYSLLGLESKSSEAEIRKSYIKLARKLHPDKSRSQHDENIFKLVTHAHSILIDVTQRRLYDFELKKKGLYYYNSEIYSSSKVGYKITSEKKKKKNKNRTSTTINLDNKFKEPRRNNAYDQQPYGFGLESCNKPNPKDDIKKSEKLEIPIFKEFRKQQVKQEVSKTEKLEEEKPAHIQRNSDYSPNTGVGTGKREIPNTEEMSEYGVLKNGAKKIKINKERMDNVSTLNGIKQNGNHTPLKEDLDRTFIAHRSPAETAVEYDKQNQIAGTTENHNINSGNNDRHINLSDMAKQLPDEEKNYDMRRVAEALNLYPNKKQKVEETHSRFSSERSFDILSQPVNKPLPKYYKPKILNLATMNVIPLESIVSRIPAKPVKPMHRSMESLENYKMAVQSYILTLSILRFDLSCILQQRIQHDKEYLENGTILRIENTSLYFNVKSYDSKICSLLTELNNMEMRVLEEFHSVLQVPTI